MAGKRSGWIPFSGSSIHIRPLASGSSASTERARNRKVPSEIAFAGNCSPLASVTDKVSSSRTSSRTTSTLSTGTSSANLADTLATILPLGCSVSFNRFNAAARCAPLSDTTVGSLPRRSGRRMALGSSERSRHFCISLRAARMVGVAIVFVVPTIVRGAVCAGARCPGPLEPPSWWTTISVAPSLLSSVDMYPDLANRRFRTALSLKSDFEWGNRNRLPASPWRIWCKDSHRSSTSKTDREVLTECPYFLPNSTS